MNETKELPTLARVKELFHYCPDTGVVTRRIGAGNIRAGEVVGFLRQRRGGPTYYACGVDNVTVRLHRLIFFYMTGRWPVLVDHANGDGLDNRWANLREADCSKNMANSAVRARGGLKGVQQRGDRWQARIKRGGKIYYLGRFDTAEAAHQAYINKAREFFGEFARAA